MIASTKTAFNPQPFDLHSNHLTGNLSMYCKCAYSAGKKRAFLKDVNRKLISWVVYNYYHTNHHAPLVDRKKKADKQKSRYLHCSFTGFQSF